jgi:mono/diheme cytochrome c family protein
LRPIGFAALAALSFAATAEEPSAAPDPMRTFSDNCAACHQADGRGIEGAFPALAGDKFVLGPAEEPIRTVLNGRGGMPTFRADLSDAQIAAALSFVRSSWGNKAPPVTAGQVASLRGGGASSPNSGH